MLAIISTEHRELIPVLTAHIYKVCPTAIPALPALPADASEDEFMKSLGMLQISKDGEVPIKYESFERFLNRTESLISLLANIVSSNPYNHELMGGHVGGIKWLQRFLLLLPDAPQSPLPLVTAPVLDAFLRGAGHMLANHHGTEFRTLLDKISNDIIHRLDVSSIGLPSSTRLIKAIENGFDGFLHTLPTRAMPELYNGNQNVTNSAILFSPHRTSSIGGLTSIVSSSPFGKSSTTTSSQSPFINNYSNNTTNNKTSASNNNQNPFGSSSATSTTTFGTSGTSAIGTKSTSNPFGGNSNSNVNQSTTFGISNPSPFGLPSSDPPISSSMIDTNAGDGGGMEDIAENNHATSTPFGAASGGTAFTNPSPFGASSNTGTQPFGNATNAAPTPFGISNPTSNQSPFGGPNNTLSSSSPFGIATTSTNSTPFGGGGGSSIFGSTAAAAPKPSPFGSGIVATGGGGAFGGSNQSTFGAGIVSNPSPFGTIASSPSPFGLSTTAPAPMTSPFGGGSTTATNQSPFGSYNTTAQQPFGNSSITPSSSSTTNQNPFGGGGGGGFGSNNNTAFGGPIAPAPTPFGSTNINPTPSFASPFGGGQQQGTRINNTNRNRPPCTFFQQGRCTKGANCNFSHEAIPINNFANAFGGPRR
jgi:GLE1-like protein/CCCH-type zinc finger